MDLLDFDDGYYGAIVVVIIVVISIAWPVH